MADWGAYDSDCAALARALEEAARQQTVPERVNTLPMPMQPLDA